MTISFLLQIGGLTGTQVAATNEGVDPAFSRNAFPFDGETHLLFIWWNFDFFKKKKTWSHHLFLFYFFKRKRNKKENPKLWLKK